MFRRPTTISILGLFIITIGIPIGFYGLTLDGGSSLGGALILIAVFFVSLIVLIDRLLVRIVGNKKLSVYESFFLLASVIFYLVQNRTLIIEPTNQNAKFVLVIENNGKLKNDKIDYKFPFDSKINTDKEFVIAKNLPDDIAIISPKSWNNTYYYNVYNYKKYPKVVVFGLNSTMLDSLTVLHFIETHIR